MAESWTFSNLEANEKGLKPMPISGKPVNNAVVVARWGSPSTAMKAALAAVVILLVTGVGIGVAAAAGAFNPSEKASKITETETPPPSPSPPSPTSTTRDQVVSELIAVSQSDVIGLPKSLNTTIIVKTTGANTFAFTPSEVGPKVIESILYNLKDMLDQDAYKKLAKVAVTVETDESYNNQAVEFPTVAPVVSEQVSKYTHVDYMPDVWDAATPKADRTPVVLRVFTPVEFDDGPTIVANKGYKRTPSTFWNEGHPLAQPFNFAPNITTQRKFPLTIHMGNGGVQMNYDTSDPDSSVSFQAGPQNFIHTGVYAPMILVEVLSIDGHDISSTDLHAALKFLHAHLPVDPEKVIMFGTSYGLCKTGDYVSRYPNKASALITDAAVCGSCGPRTLPFTEIGFFTTDIRVTWIMPYGDGYKHDLGMYGHPSDRFLLPLAEAVNPNVQHVMTAPSDYNKTTYWPWDPGNLYTHPVVSDHTSGVIAIWGKDTAHVDAFIVNNIEELTKPRPGETGKILRAQITGPGSGFLPGDVIEIQSLEYKISQHRLTNPDVLGVFNREYQNARFTVTADHIDATGKLKSLPVMDDWEHPGKGFYNWDWNTGGRLKRTNQLISGWYAFLNSYFESIGYPAKIMSPYARIRNGTTIYLDPSTFGLDLDIEMHMPESLWRPEFATPFVNPMLRMLGEAAPVKRQPTVYWTAHGETTLTSRFTTTVVSGLGITADSVVTEEQLTGLKSHMTAVSRHFLYILNYVKLPDRPTDDGAQSSFIRSLLGVIPAQDNFTIYGDTITHSQTTLTRTTLGELVFESPSIQFAFDMGAGNPAVGHMHVNKMRITLATEGSLLGAKLDVYLVNTAGNTFQMLSKVGQDYSFPDDQFDSWIEFGAMCGKTKETCPDFIRSEVTYELAPIVDTSSFAIPFKYKITAEAKASTTPTCALNIFAAPGTFSTVSDVLFFANVGDFATKPVLDALLTTASGCNFNLDAVNAFGGNAHGFQVFAAAPTTGYYYKVTAEAKASATPTCTPTIFSPPGTVGTVSDMLFFANVGDFVTKPVLDLLLTTVPGCDFNLDAVNAFGGNAHGLQVY